MPDAQRGNEDQKGKSYHTSCQQRPLIPGGVDGGDNDYDCHCMRWMDMDMGVMHTFMDVDGVVDMHPPSFPSFTVYLPSLPSIYTHILITRSTQIQRVV